MRRRPTLAFALACASLLACSGNDRRIVDHDFVSVAPTPEYPTATVAASAVAPEPKGDPKVDAEIRKVLEHVAEVRELSIKKPVHGRSLGRDALLVNLKKKAKEEIPPEALAQQGEAYRALELVPLDYDFEAGLLKLLQSEIAGYYDSDDKMMYLIDDLDKELSELTLNHELVHALQDQAFDLEPMTKYRAGHGDEDSALQALIEGDAVNGMFDAGGASSLMMEGPVVAEKFRMSMAASESAGSAPIFIRDSLVAPYADGFAFVHYLREVDGWTAVNDAFKKRRPVSTEQILHPEKFVDAELPKTIADPPVTAVAPAAPGGAWSVVMSDTFGENGFRFMFHAKGSDFEDASEFASGWGGDRYVLARSIDTGGAVSWAFALHVQMDDAAAAKRFAAALTKHVAKAGSPACVERTTLGPLAWGQKGVDFAIVAGPYKEAAATGRASASNCAAARTWIASILP